MRVSSAGGDPIDVTTLDPNEALHGWPQMLPGGNHVLFTSATRGNDFEDARVELVDLSTGDRTSLMPQAYFGRLTEAGDLLFVRGGTLYAAPVDPDTFELASSPAPIAESVMATARTGGVELSFSRTGHVIYRTGEWTFAPAVAVEVERDGRSRPLLTQPGLYYSPRFSPDGTRLALQVGGGRSSSYESASDVWVHDLARHTTTPLAVTPTPEYMPV